MLTLAAFPTSKPGIRCKLRAGLGIAGMCALAVHAAGFEPLPASGVKLENGNSAYMLCNASGKFDPASRYGIPNKPTLGSHNTCALFTANGIAEPLPGFTLVRHASRQVVMNHELTGNADKKVASVTDLVWRNAEAGECIFGTQALTLSSADADYNTQTPGKQFLRITDIARGGFAGQDIAVAYAVHASKADPVYRVGRSFTSVQYYKRSGYQRQPLTEPAFTGAINGVETAKSALPAVAQQSAALNDNWVDFTTLAGLPKRPASPMTYIKTRCEQDAIVELDDAIRLRQTAAPFIELSVPGFALPGATLDVTSQP